MKPSKKKAAFVLLVCLGLVMIPAAWAQQTKPVPADKVNLNTATVDQLQALPGIGPALAQRIIEYRNKAGKFTKIEEVLNVKGIGEKMFQKMKDRLTV